MRIRCSSLSNRKLASALHSSVLPTPVGPRNRKEPVGPVRVGQARARAADGVGHRADRLVLADHALVQLVFHLQQLLALALHQLGHRDAGGARHHLGDLLGADLGAQQLRRAASCPCSASLACGFLQRFSSSGSLPYCSSATLLKSPLRVNSSIWKRSLSISSLTWALPWACAFSAFQISSRSAISFCSLRDLFLDQRRSASARLRPSPGARPRARSAAGSGGGRAGPSPPAWSRSRS